MFSTPLFCITLRSVLAVALLLLAQVHGTLAQNSTTSGETLVFDWNITWVRANPDGLMERPVIGINNEWPVPVINATKGDRLVVTIHNLLGNESTSIHWHGLFQNGTSGMDGPVMISQCAVQPGQSATYNFTLDQAGSYWYHSHSNGQYPDGLRGALIIQDPDNPYAAKYDEERLITLSDWYHDEIPLLMKSFISVENPTGAEPVPKSALMNDTSDFQMSMVAGRTYLVRIINIGAFASQYFWMEGHTMRIVEVDGVWVDEAETDMIYISVAQRYSVLITAKDEASTNYAIVGSMDTTLFDTIPSSLNWNATGWLVYDDSADLPAATDVATFAPYDDFTLLPLDGEELLSEADYTVTLDLTMNNLGDGANYAMFNDISFVYPKVPVLYTALSAGELATNPTIYGKDSPAYVLGYGETIDIVLNNDDTGRHPFHLHGHVFQVIHRSEEDAGHFNASGVTFPSVPMKRDTLVVQPSGNFVIRFKADNPGVWFFHCHIEWHLAAGLAVTFIEAPLELQQNQEIPNGFADLCWDQGIETVGNAAANSEDWLDLTGQNMEVTPLPPGFTTKGYVAMAFSCFAGFLGMASIAWYGLAPIAQE